VGGRRWGIPRHCQRFPPPSNGGGIHSLVWTQGKYLKDGTPLTLGKENCWKDKKTEYFLRASPEINNNMGLADLCRHYIIEVKVFFRFVSPVLRVCSPSSLSQLKEEKGLDYYIK